MKIGLIFGLDHTGGHDFTNLGRIQAGYLIALAYDWMGIQDPFGKLAVYSTQQPHDLEPAMLAAHATAGDSRPRIHFLHPFWGFSYEVDDDGVNKALALAQLLREHGRHFANHLVFGYFSPGYCFTTLCKAFDLPLGMTLGDEFPHRSLAVLAKLDTELRTVEFVWSPIDNRRMK